jgi:hypothetical protein
LFLHVLRLSPLNKLMFCISYIFLIPFLLGSLGVTVRPSFVPLRPLSQKRLFLHDPFYYKK